MGASRPGVQGKTLLCYNMRILVGFPVIYNRFGETYRGILSKIYKKEGCIVSKFSREIEAAIEEFVSNISRLSSGEPLANDEVKEIAEEVRSKLDVANGNENESIERYASVSLEVQNVLDEAENRGIKISREDAETFLIEQEHKIADAMLSEGWECIGAYLEDVKEA